MSGTNDGENEKPNCHVEGEFTNSSLRIKINVGELHTTFEQTSLRFSKLSDIQIQLYEEK